MARNLGTSVENSFVKGLITEATGLNFPEQAVTETDNCVFDEIGTVRRRYGFDFEIGYETQAITVDSQTAYATGLWEAAAGNGDNSLVVQQVGLTLYFYFVSGDTVSDTLIDTIDLTPYVVPGALNSDRIECQFASGNGYLFVAHPFTTTLYVSFDPDSNTVSATEITLKIRDFEGVDDGLEVDERPVVLSEAHNYNIFNQGWDTIVRADTVGVVQQLAAWRSHRSNADYPSRCDFWWFFRAANANNLPQYGLEETNPQNSPANRGHYILDYLEQDRDTASGLSGVTGRSSDGENPSAVSFFAGRVWYAGVLGQYYSNRILFSQIIERDEQIGQCYQQNDPTAEDIFDILPSDGGTILIPDAGTIIKLFAYEDKMLVFATNGVWAIAGSEGVGFRATDYSVVKLSAVPSLTASSFVSLQGTPCFWNSDAIYVVSTSEVGATNVQTMTDSAIKQYFQSIPLNHKKFARGVYNSATRIISWLYSDSEDTSPANRYGFNRVLNFNTLTQAFYVWSIDVSDVGIKGIVIANTGQHVGVSEVVTVDGVNVTVGAEDVYSFVMDTTQGFGTKYLVTYTDGGLQMTFAEPWNGDYVDWFSLDETGVEYDSYFTTGFKISGEGIRKVQPTYVHLFFKTDEVDNTIDFRSIWQYATSSSTGRFSSTQRFVTASNDYTYTRRRAKTRGSGNVYQFRVDSVASEPFELIGWSVFETANSSV